MYILLTSTVYNVMNRIDSIISKLFFLDIIIIMSLIKIASYLISQDSIIVHVYILEFSKYKCVQIVPK